VEHVTAMHEAVKRLDAALDEARAQMSRVADIPLSGRRGVVSDLMRAGYARPAALRIGSDAQEVIRTASDLLGRAKGEVEVLSAVADEAIGSRGRLF
jgi:hypothetical protein